MSLLVWLPLNGDLINNGLSNVNITTSSTCSFEEGILNQSLRLNNGNTSVFKIPELSNSKFMTISFWCKYNKCVSQFYDIIHWNTSNGTDTLSRLEVFSDTVIGYFGNEWSQYPANGTSTNINGGMFIHHVWVINLKETYIKYYINGKYYATYGSYGSGSTTDYYITGENFRIGDTGLDINLNDVRIYNECLSAKEIKEISKGMILHYPLSSPYNVSIKNYFGYLPSNIKLIDTDVFEEYGIHKAYQIFSSSSTGIKYTPLYASETLVEGETYTLTCYAYASLDSNDDFTFLIQPESRVQSQIKKVTYMNGAANKGKPYKMYMTFIAKANTNFTLLYMQGYGGSFTTGYQLWGGFQLYKGAEILDYIEDTLSDSIEYDVSGFNNHATNNSIDKLPIYNSISPINNGSYLFGNTQYIRSSTTSVPLNIMKNMTINFWFMSNNNDTWTLWSDVISLGQYYLRLESTNTTGTSFYWYGNIDITTGINNFGGGFSITAMKWYMVSLVINNNVPVMYLDGTKLNINCNTITDGYTLLDGAVQIGDSDNRKTNFNMSDLRIYATALTDTDIQELYNTRYSVTNTGTLITTSEIIEEVEE